MNTIRRDWLKRQVEAGKMEARCDFYMEPFRLMPYQKKLIGNMLGWKRADGARLYRTAYLGISRKNAKTQTCAAIGLDLIEHDGDGQSDTRNGDWMPARIRNPKFETRMMPAGFEREVCIDSDFVEGQMNMMAHEFSGKSGSACGYPGPGDENRYTLRVHSNLCYTLRLKPVVACKHAHVGTVDDPTKYQCMDCGELTVRA